jgi:hypothetical protein
LTPEGQAARVAIIDASIDELPRFNEFDIEHLNWEEIKDWFIFGFSMTTYD